MIKFTIPNNSLAVDLSQDPVKVYNGQTLNVLIDNLAGALISCDLPPGTNIGLLGYNSVPMLIISLALFKTSHMCVPLNYKLSKDNLHECIRMANVGLIFCDKQFKHLVPDHVPVIQFGKEFEKFVSINYNLSDEIDPNKLYLSLFTSGTTGKAKKVDYTVQDRLKIARHCETTASSSIFKLGQQYRTLCANPFFHHAGLAWAHNGILNQCSIFVLPKFDAKLFLQTISKFKIQHLNMVTPMMSMLLTESKLISELDMSSVTQIALPSSFACVSVIESVEKVFCNAKQIVNFYGLTEIGSLIFDQHPENLSTPKGSVGYPKSDMEIKLIDSVLYVRKTGFTSQYDTENQEWFNTNDMFVVDDNGFYYYIGRKDDMFKCGGEKVYPIEIESVLNQHPCVSNSVAIGIENPVKGYKPYAFVQVKCPVTELDILAFVQDKLAYYQIPKRIWIIDKIPITEVGKIDKKYLVQLATQYIQI